MNAPPEPAEVTGYTPPPVDLSPFRAGTVWHYRNVAYLVTGMQFRESAGQRVKRYLSGEPAHGEVGPDGRTEVAMRLERADWLDALPMAQMLDGYDQPGTRLLFIASGDHEEAWGVADFVAVALMPHPMRVRDMATGELPQRLEVTLWRRS